MKPKEKTPTDTSTPATTTATAPSRVQPEGADEFNRLLQQDHKASVFQDPEQFAHAQRVAKLLNTSTLVPEHFRGDVNFGNAVIAVDLAFRMGFSPLMVMQHTYIVHGKPGFSAQFVIAAINAGGKFTPLEFEFSGDGDKRQCVAIAKRAKGEKELRSTPVTIDIAKKEGWFGKTGSKWQTMPDQMLLYRSASFWGRAYSPETLMGMQTVEELQDIGPEGTNRTREIKSPVFGSSKAPSLFPAGGESTPEAEVKEPLPTTPPHPTAPDSNLVKLRAVMAKEKPPMDDATILLIMRGLGTVDDSLSSLEEIFEVTPTVIDACLKSWKSIVLARKTLPQPTELPLSSK